MAGDIKNPATTDKVATGLDESDPLAPLTTATKDAAGAIAQVEDAIRNVGSEIIRLDAQVAPSTFQSQHLKLRVRAVVINVLTAGVCSLNVATVSYPFSLPANGIVQLIFPLVIERGMDLSFTAADGRIYLIGDPE